jgi:predicted KAP-like P-loop ATPase
MEENSEMIWKIWKKGKLNSEKIWKIQKKIVKRYEKYGRKVG